MQTCYDCGASPLVAFDVVTQECCCATCADRHDRAGDFIICNDTGLARGGGSS